MISGCGSGGIISDLFPEKADSIAKRVHTTGYQNRWLDFKERAKPLSGRPRLESTTCGTANNPRYPIYATVPFFCEGGMELVR
jgi:hypothetical protein